MVQPSEKKFPLTAKGYKLYEEVGKGVSATVYRALCVPLNVTVAIKVLDLEKCNNDLDGIQREVQTMMLIYHQNLLRAHCSFTTDHNLWVVMPYMAGGSCLHIIKSAYPDGFEEHVIATFLHEVLKALVYLHAHGHIHRDVKAGNILIESSGAIKLADFGVTACMFDTGDRQRSRNTFVGTPCWMAPEVMQQLHGNDFKADIWSFGITALELAHGHAPFSKYPPMKILLMTLQSAPPSLDYERNKRFSKAFKDMVSACLVKDPKKRPTAEKLLKHPFFKHTRSHHYLSCTILDGLPPLGERFRMLKEKEADMLLQNKILYKDQEHLSQQEYIRGISAWNFNLEDLKNQASLVQEDTDEDSSMSKANENRKNDAGSPVNEIYSEHEGTHPNATSQQEDEINDIDDLENSFAAFPIKPLQALKGYFDVRDEDNSASSSNSKDSAHSDPEQQSQHLSSTSAVNEEFGRDDTIDYCTRGILPYSVTKGRRETFSGSVLPDKVFSPRKLIGDADRENLPPRSRSQRTERNYSGPLQCRQKKDCSIISGEDASEGAVMERRGHFKLTAGDLNYKGIANYNPISSVSSSLSAAALVLPSLQWILQQNAMQREEIAKLMMFVEQTLGTASELMTGMNDMSEIALGSAKERELQARVIQLQQSIDSQAEELRTLRYKNNQMERKLSAKYSKDEELQAH